MFVSYGHDENVALVEIFRRRKGDDPPRKIACRDDGKLRLEGNPFLKDASRRLESPPDLLGVTGLLQPQLAFPVVSKIRRLEN